MTNAAKIQINVVAGGSSTARLSGNLISSFVGGGSVTPILSADLLHYNAVGSMGPPASNWTSNRGSASRG
jgi:hypothetical protein